MTSRQKAPKYFYRFLGAHALSGIGDSFTEIALSALVYKLTHSALLTGLMLAMDGFANLFFGLIVTSIIDRFSKKWLMIISDVLRACTVLCLLFISQKEHLWVAYAVYFLNESIALFFNPSQKSLIPSLIPEKYLEHGNNLIDTLQNSLRLFGPLLAGFVVGWLGTSFTFIFDSFTYITSAVLIASIVFHQTTHEAERSIKHHPFREITEGFSYIKNNKVIFYNIILSAVSMFGFGVTNFFMIYYAFSVLNGDVRTYGFMQSALGGGTILGSLLAFYIFSKIKGNYSQIRGIGLLISGLFMIMRGLTTSIPIALFTYVMVSLFTMPSKVATTTLIQKYGDPKFHGRIFSCFYSLATLASLISMGIGALALHWISVSAIFIIAGFVIILSTLASFKAVSFEKNILIPEKNNA